MRALNDLLFCIVVLLLGTLIAVVVAVSLPDAL